MLKMIFDYTIEDTGYYLGPSIGMILFLVIVPGIISILIMIWVYKDAKKRNMEPILWLVLIFFFGCCGLLIYVIARADHPPVEQGGIYGTQGPSIGTAQYDPTQYGQPQPQPRPQTQAFSQTQYTSQPAPIQQKKTHKSKFCKFCGAEMPYDAKFCSICGANEFND